MVLLTFSLGRKAPVAKSPAAVKDVPGHLHCRRAARGKERALRYAHKRSTDAHHRKSPLSPRPNVGTNVAYKRRFATNLRPSLRLLWKILQATSFLAFSLARLPQLRKCPHSISGANNDPWSHSDRPSRRSQKVE